MALKEHIHTFEKLFANEIATFKVNSESMITKYAAKKVGGGIDHVSEKVASLE
jgi:hypothetical protein